MNKFTVKMPADISSNYVNSNNGPSSSQITARLRIKEWNWWTKATPKQLWVFKNRSNNSLKDQSVRYVTSALWRKDCLLSCNWLVICEVQCHLIKEVWVSISPPETQMRGAGPTVQNEVKHMQNVKMITNNRLSK